jgi:hypothetical protein
MMQANKHQEYRAVLAFSPLGAASATPAATPAMLGMGRGRLYSQEKAGDPAGPGDY